jgi:dihydropyrimidinase
MSDLQFMLPMYFSEGVGKRRLPLQRFVETASTNAARVFGLYPKKGVIAEGSDADIAIWDPNRTATVTAEADFSKSDYSAYEGWKVTGWPVTMIRRGEVVFDAGRHAGRAGTGQLVSRARWMKQ